LQKVNVEIYRNVARANSANSILKETAIKGFSCVICRISHLFQIWYSFRPTMKNNEVIAEKQFPNTTGVPKGVEGAGTE